MNARRSELTRSLWVEHRPCGAPRSMGVESRPTVIPLITLLLLFVVWIRILGGLRLSPESRETTGSRVLRGAPRTVAAARRAGLQPGRLRVVCVADRSPKTAVQLSAVEDDLLGMHRLDSIQRDTELACILHVHHQTIRRYVPDRAELIVSIGNEGLVPDFDRLSHDPPSQ